MVDVRYTLNWSLFSAIQGPIVTFLVGRDKKPFQVHRDILCSKSDYFSHLLPTHNFSDLTLDADPAAVALFVNFLYWQHYTLPRSCRDRSEQIITHARLYILGTHFRITRLQEEALAKIYELVKGEGRCDDRRLELTREVYISVAAPEDELKRLLAETIAARWQDYREDLTLESELGMLMEEFPIFARNVLGRLGNGGIPTSPQLFVQPKGIKRKMPDCD